MARLATADHGILVCQASGATTQVWDVEVSCSQRVLALFRCTQLVLDGRRRTGRQNNTTA